MAARSGYFRFTYPNGQRMAVLANRFPGELVLDGTNAITGVEHFNGMQAYVYGEFDTAIKVASYGAEKKHLVISTEGSGKVLEFRYGISFISVEQAKKSLRTEIPDWSFSHVEAVAKKRWNEVLGQIEVEGGTETQRRVFYTALYRCYERMVNITEDGRYYSAFDHKIHEDARPFYVDNWIWDMYRALHPLQLLLNPDMEADQIQSYVRMYEQSGRMPKFALLPGSFPCMIGNHTAAWMADAWFKGVRKFDVRTAYEGLEKNSLDATLLPWRSGPKTSLDDFYSTNGYFPALYPDEQETVPEVHPYERRQAISVTLENSYDDWCIAQLSRVSGHASDYPLFIKRAGFYKNVFRQDRQSVWPKDQHGNWIEPYDPGFSGGPGGRAYTSENNGYTYDWDVQHDLTGLFVLMGGRTNAETELDNLFRTGLGRGKAEFLAAFTDSTGMVGQFSMGNEPSFHIPYIYDYLGSPWKTQKRIRTLLNTWFTDTVMGIPGDEDGGAMSAFVVFSMMGFYPETPGIPIYVLGSPVFNRVKIHLHNGNTFSIQCPHNSPTNVYIQRVKLNGKEQSNVWIKHADILKGGTLELEMGDTPNRKLGAKPECFPPSSISFDPRMLNP